MMLRIIAAPNSAQSKSLKRDFGLKGRITSVTQRGDGRDLVIGGSIAFLVVLVENRFRHRCGCVAAVAAVLDEYGNDNFRIPIGRKTDKPRVILVLTTLAIVLFSNDLRRSGLAGDIEPRNLRCLAGTLV